MFKVNGDEVRFHHNHGGFIDITGITDCSVQVGSDVFRGIAVCNKADNYSKSTGRKIALTRAISKFPREVRAKYWKAYWDKINENKP